MEEKPKIIVSLTSYPPRIKKIHKTIDSLLYQTLIPNKIVLYLSEIEFQNKEEVKKLLENYEQTIFEIRWVSENYMSHKKYYYAFSDFSQDLVILADDDVIYDEKMIEQLIKGRQKHKDSIIARRGARMTMTSDGKLDSYNNWYGGIGTMIDCSRLDMFFTTGGGTLFPPNAMDCVLLHGKDFWDVAPKADDVWLNLVTKSQKITTVLVLDLFEDEMDVSNVETLYGDYNADGGNDLQIRATISKLESDMGEGVVEKIIFSEGGLFSFDIEKQEYIDMHRIYDSELKTIIEWFSESCGIYIYGAGKTSKNSLEFLGIVDYLDKMLGFMVSSMQNNDAFVEGYAVKVVEECHNKNAYVWIPLLNLDEAEKIKRNLIEQGFNGENIKIPTSREKKIVNYCLKKGRI